MRELDPVGTALRWRGTVCPRNYNVRCPNALWHIDGNHKMIRWRFVIHTLTIDVYSSLTPYLYCAKKNNFRFSQFKYMIISYIHIQLRHSLTVSKCMPNLCSYGIPSRVRSDHGLENVCAAARCWSALECRGSMITGSSVHNQRAERLHRDVISGVLKSYTDEFHMMEASGLLDPLKKIHLLSLHLVLL